MKKFITALMLVFLICLIPCQKPKATKIEGNKITLNAGQKREIKIKTDKPQVFINSTIVNAKNTNQSATLSMNYNLKDSNGKVYQNDTDKFSVSKNLPYEYDDWWSDDGVIPAGEYTYTITNNSSVPVVIEYTLERFSQIAKSITIAKTVKVKAGELKSVKITKPSDSAFLADFKISNNKVANVLCGESNDRLNIDGFKIGKTKITIYNLDGATQTFNVEVVAADPALEYIQYKMDKGQKFKNKLYDENNSVASNKKIKWSTSNKKVATVSSSGTVTAKGKGSCYIYAKYKKKKYRCKVIVYLPEPDFYAQLWEYNTRGNYFTVYFKNLDKKPIYITSGVKVRDDDYKSYDRKIKLGKTIKIKSGQTKLVKFKVKGRVTWPLVKDFTLYYKFKHAGTTYSGRVWDEDSSFKRGKTWYNTYYDEDGYSEWLYE